MKKNNITITIQTKEIKILKNILRLLLLCLLIPVISACSQRERDQQIKADIAIKAKEDINFAGVQFTVVNSKVTLFGNCPTTISKGLVKQKLSTIHIIDSVEDRLQIAPVTIGADFSMKQQVDSVLATYSTVTAEVSDTSVALIGRIEKEELGKLLKSIKKINPGTIHTDRLIFGI